MILHNAHTRCLYSSLLLECGMGRHGRVIASNTYFDKLDFGTKRWLLVWR